MSYHMLDQESDLQQDDRKDMFTRLDTSRFIQRVTIDRKQFHTPFARDERCQYVEQHSNRIRLLQAYFQV